MRWLLRPGRVALTTRLSDRTKHGTRMRRVRTGNPQVARVASRRLAGSMRGQTGRSEDNSFLHARPQSCDMRIARGRATDTERLIPQ